VDEPSTTRASQHRGRGRVFDSIMDAIGDTPIVRLQRLPRGRGANTTILAIAPSFSERYLSTALFEGI
jgi:cysteine synthase